MFILVDNSTEQLENEIEKLRKQLHNSVKFNEENIALNKDEILKISKKLDELIIQYMSIK